MCTASPRFSAQAGISVKYKFDIEALSISNSKNVNICKLIILHVYFMIYSCFYSSPKGLFKYCTIDTLHLEFD